MNKIYRILIVLIIILTPYSAKSHVKHYEELNRIKFDIYRNNNHIGTHVFSFKKEEEKLFVESEINFKIKKLGVVLYKYVL